MIKSVKTELHSTSLLKDQNSYNGTFKCSNLDLDSLEGCPKRINGSFYCSDNKLRSLKGCPKIVHGLFDCSYNHLESLKYIHKYIETIEGQFLCLHNPIKSHLLGLFLIKDMFEVGHEAYWADIVNKHIKNGRKGILACQKEFIENGLKEYAQL